MAGAALLGLGAGAWLALTLGWATMPGINFHAARLAVVLLAGLLVGIGTFVWCNGCTSGHGICGMGRLSLRSMSPP